MAGGFDFSGMKPGEVQTELGGGWTGGTVDWGKAFLWSAAESVPELVGITPSEDTLKWRATNPWSGIASEMAGMVVPYAGWYKAASYIPKLGTAVKALEATKTVSPFAAHAGAEALRFLPFEAGRVGVSQFIGDKGLGEMAGEAAVNLTLGSVFAGGLGVLGAAGKVPPKLQEMIPGIEGDLPAPLILRKIDEHLGTMPEAGEVLRPFQERFDEIARGETASRYVAPLASGNTDTINRLFISGQSGPIHKRRAVSGAIDDTTSFDRPEEWMGAFSKAGLDPATISRNAQYPRHISFSKQLDVEANAAREAAGAIDLERAMRDGYSSLEARSAREGWEPARFAREVADMENGLKSKKNKTEFPKATAKANAIENDIASNLKAVGEGWFIGREAEDGLFVMAKKSNGTVGQAAPDDEWVLFKTDRPGEFAKRQQTVANADIAREKWIVGSNLVEENAKPGTLPGAVAEAQSVLDYGKYADASQAAGPKGLTAKAIDKMTLPALKGNVASQHFAQIFKTYFLPAAQQLKRSTRGRWVLGQGQLYQGMINSNIQKVLQGTVRLGEKQGLLKASLNPKFEGESLFGAIDELEKNGLLDEFWDRLVRQGMGAQKAAQLASQGLIKSDTARLAGVIERLSDGIFGDLNAFERMAGRTPTRARKGHYGFERQWDGDQLVALRDESGKVIGIAAGQTRAAANAEAKALATKLTKEVGRPVRVGEGFTRGLQSGNNIPRDLIPFVTNPGFMLERQNIRGFKFDSKNPTGKELKELLQNSMDRKARVMGTLARESLLTRHINALSVEDPYALSVVSTRFNQMAGVEGDFSKAQNAMADKVLAPFLGRNSATKIVQVTNKALMNLQLGFGKLGYPITNVVGTLQTVLPELAFVMNGIPETVNGTYHMAVPVMGTKGPQGFMGVLNPLKIYGQSMKEMARPGADLLKGFERGVNDRLLTPRMVEDYIGQGGKDTLTNFKGAIGSGKGFVEWVTALSEFMPRMSEELARNMSFTAGWIAARDIRGLTDPDAIYAFAKQFTERTSYLYSSADRPLVFTGPIGSSMGLFKNWMMNYIAGMAEYTQLGITQKNWSPLAWQLIGTAATGGAAATPLYWAAEGAAKMFADKSLMQWAYDEFSGGEADAMMFGLPAALTGVSLSSSMTSPGANPVRDASQLFSFAIWDRAKNLGQAVGAAFDNHNATGTHPGHDPDVRAHLVRAFAPVNIYRTMATQEEGTIRSLGSDLPQIKGLGPMDIWLYRMGLQPTEIDRQLKMASEIYESREKRKAAVSALGDAMMEAIQAGDSKEQQVILQRALYLGVDISSVYKSSKTRLKAHGEDVTERLTSAKELARWQNVRNPQYGE